MLPYERVATYTKGNQHSCKPDCVFEDWRRPLRSRMYLLQSRLHPGGHLYSIGASECSRASPTSISLTRTYVKRSFALQGTDLTGPVTGLLNGNPEDRRNIFGNWSDAYTVRRF
ncbi:hypothetical protein C8Q78DRAFT_751758 [Trametes maxima]|nr:hypothetical protein C8Q78DRAFT_751758 [Trametes maxima]